MFFCVYCVKYTPIYEKQEIISIFIKQARIENYSVATVKNYVSVLKLFLQYVSKLPVDKITDVDIQNYLYYFKNQSVVSV